MNLAFVKKQFALPERLVVPGATGHVLGDMSVDQKRAAGFEVHVGVADVGFAFAKGFYFGSVKDQTGLEFFENVIVVRSRTVLGHDLFAWPLGLFTFRFLGALGWFGHNLSFYLMTRLIRMSGTAASPGALLASYRPTEWRKVAELAHGMV